MTDPMPQPQHLPVLADAVLEYLDPQPGQTIVDCTCGLAGHAMAIGERLGTDGRLICLDQDDTYLSVVREKLASLSAPSEVLKANFVEVADALSGLGIEKVDGILADLGVSSAQLDDPSRGFSFLADGPLDMRIDRSLRTTAADLVNSLPEKELADLLYTLGDERFSRKIARAIYQARHQGRITTTGALAQLIARTLNVDPQRRPGRIHPATRTFLALRIAVNREFETLKEFMASVPDLLNVGGRIAVISFHSGEDRLIKISLQQGRQEGVYEILTRKPITPSEDEIRRNARSRSSKLRAARRV